MANEYIEIVTVATSAAGGSDAKPILNVYRFRRASGSGTPNKTQIHTAFNTAIQTKVALAVHEDYVQTKSMLRFVDDALDPYLDITVSNTGAITGDRLPDYCAVTVRLKTLVRGKFARGSKHYGPLGESQTLADVLVAGSITLFGTVGAAIVAGFTDAAGNVWVPSIVSSVPPAQYTTNPVTVVANDVTSYVLNQTLGTMRRRKVRSVS